MRPVTLSVLLALVAGCGDTSLQVAADAAPSDASPDAFTDASADAIADASTDAVTDATPARRLVWRGIDLSTGPASRWGYMVADLGDGTAYVFGGTTLTNAGAGTTSSDLWRFDGTVDPPTFTAVTVTGDPPRRYCGCLGYIPTSRTVVMIGGRTPSEAPAETWLLPLDTMTWERASTDSTPGGVIGCNLAWSQARGALYHFGGGSSSTGYSGTVSRWNASTRAWERLDATGPRGRYDAVWSPMPDGRTLLLTMGARTAVAGAGFLNDVWRFDTMTDAWSQVTIEGEAPQGRRNPFVRVDADGRGLVLAMGAAGIRAGETLADTWHLDLDAGRWTNLDPKELPPARGFVTALPGRGAVRGTLVGGFDNDGVRRDAWQLREE